jgi:predicted ATPase
MICMKTPPHYVLTGGPCAGKTTVSLEIKKRGYSVLEESARAVIDEMLGEGKTLDAIRSDEGAFQKAVLRRKVVLEANIPQDQVIFLDRAIPDSIAYYRENKVPEDEELWSACRAARYAKVFLLELLPPVADNARNESPELAARLQATLDRGYRELGYEPVRVPVMPVKERTDFILANL